MIHGWKKYLPATPFSSNACGTYIRSRQMKKHLVKRDISTFLRTSNKNDDFNICGVVGSIDASTLVDITEKEVDKCIAERWNRWKTGYQLYLVDQTVKNTAVNTNSTEAELIVWKLRREYHNKLRLTGYAHIMKSKPHIAINHILRKTKLPHLYERMLDIINPRKKENFYEEIFDGSIREIAV